ncbi:hypothetical protein Leryth_022868 [Lithospermum erythrorhizon]|nr:hypothetical protein Leryth_022868 [Lithospermum erythrorhizon]
MLPLEEEFVGGEEHCLLPHPDPIMLEMNRLQNQLKVKDHELEKAHNEIKALRGTEVLKDKALEELHDEINKSDDKLQSLENLLEQKNLDIKKLVNEKKETLAAQYAAEATLRRVYTEQNNDDSFPIESIIAPLEAKIKMYKNEVAFLQEDNKALERLTKSKEAALIEAERILKSALERALIVEEVHNQNLELKRQIEIHQEEIKILDKTYRLKVKEVEKLSRTIKELEEAVLAGGAAANSVRHYKRQISELQEEKRTLERELARAKVSANRVATVVANEWKDENDKVMPIKQWVEERKLLQAELQRLRDKLAISERKANAEEQMKEKFKMRLKILEEGLKQQPKPEKSNNFFGILSSNVGSKKRSSSQPRGSTIRRMSEQLDAAQENSKLTDSRRKSFGENVMKKNSLWAGRSKIIDRFEKENIDAKENASGTIDNHIDQKALGDVINNAGRNEETESIERMNGNCDDVVSGFLYDRIQKEVISMRKACEIKESTLKTKDEEIKVLMKKIDTLSKAMEVQSKKMKREAENREKSSDGMTKGTNISKRITRTST